mgnify:CR=1 FL=1
MSVKVVRMLSGEDVLCECEDKESYLEVKDSVVIATPDKSLEDQHKKMFGGIITPDSMLVS